MFSAAAEHKQNSLQRASLLAFLFVVYHINKEHKKFKKGIYLICTLEFQNNCI